MLKILVVDDETPIREWIEFCINKRPEVYEIVGLASNGEEALEMFNSFLPDIVLTDIKMPIMDGLELMNQIKLLKASTEIIVLTAHSDFEYARTAVKYGAVEYILKTEINDKVIHESLDKVKTKIKNIQENNSNDLNTLHLKREAFIRYLISQKENAFNISENELQEQNIYLKNNFLFAVALKYKEDDKYANNKNIFVIPKHDKIQNTFGFIYDKNTLVLLANLFETPSMLMQIKTTFDFTLELKRNNGCTLGLSGIYVGLKHIGEAVNEAVCQLKQEFYNGEGSINQMGTVIESAEPLKQLETMESSLKETIKQSGVNTAEDAMDKIFSFIKEHKINDIDAVKNVCIQVIDFMYTYIECYKHAGIDSVHTIKEEIVKIDYFHTLQNYVRSKIKEVINFNRKESKGYSLAIMKSVGYISTHYAKPVNLTDVAAFVHLNPEYFCRLFKEETGKNFSNYLVDIRLNKSVELLKNTSMKVYEIAELVGYSNLSYFSTSFKKHFGVNPFDFRNKNSENKY